MSLKRDKLFLLRPGFEDPSYPGKRFFCWHCALLEGLLASHPTLSEKLDVERIEWSRPRQPLINILGEDNQSLPVLILKEGTTSNHKVWNYCGLHFANDKDEIFAILAERYGIPEPHP